MIDSDFDVRPLAGPLWSAIVEAAERGRLPITYGDLSEKFFGHRRSGQAFRYWLGNIHSNIEIYDKKHALRGGQTIPFLNGAVVQANSREVGPGAPPTLMSAEEAARRIVEISAEKWRSIGTEIGYDLDRRYRMFAPKSSKSGKSKGPSGGGVRSEAIWEARHSPIVDEIELQISSEYSVCECSGCDPDLYVQHKSDGFRMLIEVKPNQGTHNIITAIGQYLSYNYFAGADICIIAGPGFEKDSVVFHKYRKFLEINNISIIDTEKPILAQIRHFRK